MTSVCVYLNSVPCGRRDSNALLGRAIRLIYPLQALITASRLSGVARCIRAVVAVLGARGCVKMCQYVGIERTVTVSPSGAEIVPMRRQILWQGARSYSLSVGAFEVFLSV